MKSLLVKVGVVLIFILALWGCYAKPQVLKEYVQGRIDPSSINNQEQLQKDLDECISFGMEQVKKITPWYVIPDGQTVSIQRDAAIDRCMRNKGYRLLQVGDSPERMR
jgi:hypothetical protein